MSETKRRLYWIWIAVPIITILLIYFVSSILMPFVVGIAVAYFLDPIVDKLEELGISRTAATVFIIISFFAVVVLILLLLFPLLQSQFIGFLDKVPLLLGSLEEWVAPFKEAFVSRLASENLKELSGVSNPYSGPIVQWFGNIIKGILHGGLAIFNGVSLVLVTPVVIFYLLRDWDLIVKKVDNWLPRDFAPSIRVIVKDIDLTIAGFVRGQGTVCLFLAAFYGFFLTIIGLDFGLILGVSTGLISFVPYFGMLIGMAVTMAIAIFQYGEFIPVVLVIAIFGVGQVIESMFLTPKLVGEKVGLHAVWVIFALMVGGAEFGFTGLLLAVPVAATIGVLVRFSITLYLKSALYTGSSNSDGSH
ncbi:MAG: AI-2E family transporter [Pseudomonadota bacterium]|nr:AI-2E family transporter [Pseudomonadota bacterium]